MTATWPCRVCREPAGDEDACVEHPDRHFDCCWLDLDGGGDLLDFIRDFNLPRAEVVDTGDWL